MHSDMMNHLVRLSNDNPLRGGLFVKRNKWFGLILSAALLLSVFNPVGVFAEKKRTLQDESIYDLLVDRFNNGNYENDEDVDAKNKHAFAGGDFAGIISRLDYIADLGFTLVSIGPVFSTETYDGNRVLDYEKLEPHFGTTLELKEMIEALKERNLGVVVDFPLNGVSEDHKWVKDGTLASISNGDGTVQWDASNEKVKETLKEMIISFAEEYDFAGIRLTNIGEFDESFLNEVIKALKEKNEERYVISNENSKADFDTVPNTDKIEALKKAYVQVDPETSPLSLFEDDGIRDLIQFDDLIGPRFTHDMFELRMFPPTRWKMAAVPLFTLPGVPVMPYETEIAINGKEAPDTHPVVNFKTDMELYDYISDLNKLRNQSETLRNGKLDILHNEDGFTVYTRTSDEETWVIALNNRSETSNLEISEALIGENKRLRGLLDGDMIRQSKDGKYRLVLEREVAEVYIVDEDQGFNTLYLVASILIYATFLGFLFAVWRRNKKKKMNE